MSTETNEIDSGVPSLDRFYELTQKYRLFILENDLHPVEVLLLSEWGKDMITKFAESMRAKQERPYVGRCVDCKRELAAISETEGVEPCECGSRVRRERGQLSMQKKERGSVD